MSRLFVLSGPPGAGKSTVARLLGETLKRSVVIEGDSVYHMVCGGYVAPWLAGNHMELFWKNICSLVNNSLALGYDVVFEYVVPLKSVALLQQACGPLTLAVLLPAEEELLRRDAARPADERMGARCSVVYREFLRHRFLAPWVLRTENETPQQTAARVLALPPYPQAQNDRKMEESGG